MRVSITVAFEVPGENGKVIDLSTIIFVSTPGQQRAKMEWM